MEVEGLLNTLAKTLAEATVNTHMNTVRDVDYEALVDSFAASLAYMETDTHRDTLSHLQEKYLQTH